MVSRRDFLKAVAAGTVAGLWLPRSVWAQVQRDFGVGPFQLPEGTIAASKLEALPEKVPLIKRTYRPPNYETPVKLLNEMYTPNNAFFVRYHLANIPRVDAKQWRLRVAGQKQMELTLDDLKNKFDQVEVPAVCMCSGNRRGFFQPHVAGIEWGPGAMGNARWRGVRLKDLLNQAGVAKDAIEIGFNGADGPVLNETPDFIKSIPVWKALDENTIIATEMNGQPLPHWNGFPARVIVPGWTATYWVKNLTEINVLNKPEENFWMKTAYRVPVGKFPAVDRFMTQETAMNTPITEMVVSSLITNIEPGQKFSAGRAIEVRGIAWDGGYGISTVSVSIDDGKTWYPAKLGQDAGKYSWRQWSYAFRPKGKGRHIIAAKASNRIGQTQTPELIQNPAGYHHNVIQRMPVQVV